jgi:phospholipase/carboxylesterase
VPVQSDTELVTFQEWTIRVRPAVQSPARLLLLVHGWTGDENSMWVFARNLRPNYHIVAPRAPHVAQPSGYSWRSQQLGEQERPNFRNLQPAAESLFAFVEDYAAARSLDAAQFSAMGFSQGAALVGVMTLMRPARLGRAGILAGFVPEGGEQFTEGRPLEGKPVFVAHGTLDEKVPVEYARRSVKLLEQAGAQVTYCEDDVGHKLSLRCLRAMEVFFS